MNVSFYPFLTRLSVFLTLGGFWAFSSLAQSVTGASEGVNPVPNTIDSLAQSEEEKWQPVDTTLQHTNQHLDTLEQVTDIDASTKKLTSPVADSLNSVEQTVTQPVESVIDTTHQLLDKLDVIKQTNRKVQSAEGKLKSKVTNTKPVQDTQSALDNIERETDLAAPGADLPNVPGLAGDGLPGQPDLSTGTFQEIKALPGEHLGEVKGVGDIQQASEHLGTAKDITGKVGTYGKDAKAISQGKLNEVEQLPQAGEKALSGTKEIQALKEQEGALKAVQGQPEELKGQISQYGDQEFLKQKAKQKLIEQSVDHFAGRTQELQAAQQQLSKLKRKYSHVNTQTGKLVKRTSLKGKSLKERLTGGFTLQIHQGPPTAFDISPFVGYKLSKRWSSGIGGTYRLAFDGNNRLIWDYPVYGFRGYTQCQLFKKFLLHAEYERLRALVPNPATSPDNTQRQWVDGVLVGGGKRYNVTKKIKGNVLFLRNFTYLSQGPYSLKWNIRMGFYI
ncbi:hypothetical protein [Tunicatimonas pelagia]|uniref:hypothetical protein n=1 Tax=Tunicatimonas pelagia TaxID=931531 RepID=UPI00266705ED|nr:hypothetical protein [Tunicatimonas pelagia]WKN43953.1 hypothetical protein P0M28_03075 [Tunicatimonas pelagia]